MEPEEVDLRDEIHPINRPWQDKLAEQIPRWLVSASLALIVGLLVISFFTGRKITFWPELGFDPPAVEGSGVTGGDLPVGAVVAFTGGDLEPGGCRTLGSGWVEFVEGRGRFILGAGLSADKSRGFKPLQEGGEYEVTLTEQQMPKHRHVTNTATIEGYDTFDIKTFDTALNGAGGPGTSSKTYAFTDMAGLDQPHDNMPPYIALTWCKKGEPDGE